MIKQFSYQSETYFEPGKAVGLILLQTDETLENEVRQFLTQPTTIYHSRVPSGEEVTEETLAKIEAEIPTAVRLFPPSGQIGVVAYGCTSGSTIIGEAKVEEAIQSVLPNVKTTNPLTALKARLSNLDVSKIGLLTPYEPQVSQSLADHLMQHGIEIAKFGSFFEKEEAKVSRISQKSIYDAIMEIGNDDNVEAVFASCTNLRTVDLLQKASQDLEKPVLSSNSVLSWHIDALLEN